MNVKQYANGDDDVYRKPHYKSDTEDGSDTVKESKCDTDDELHIILYDIKSAFDYSLQLRKKFKEKNRRYGRNQST